MIPCPWLAAFEVGNRWLAGWRVLFRQDEFPGFRDAQDVFLSFVHDDDLTGPLHELPGVDPSSLGP